MKKSIVRSVVFQKSGTGQYGEYHIFTVEFENGDKGNYMAKKNPQTSFTQGQQAEYEIVKQGDYTNIKPAKKEFKGGFKGTSNKVYALNNAVLLACHGQISMNQVKDYAQSFKKFLDED